MANGGFLRTHESLLRLSQQMKDSSCVSELKQLKCLYSIAYQSKRTPIDRHCRRIFKTTRSTQGYIASSSMKYTVKSDLSISPLAHMENTRWFRQMLSLPPETASETCTPFEKMLRIRCRAMVTTSTGKSVFLINAYHFTARRANDGFHRFALLRVFMRFYGV